MKGWKEKLLSQAGKEIMIKAIIQSIPTYSMSVFRLPTSLCKDIEAMIKKFWWGARREEENSLGEMELIVFLEICGWHGV